MDNQRTFKYLFFGLAIYPKSRTLIYNFLMDISIWISYWHPQTVLLLYPNKSESLLFYILKNFQKFMSQILLIALVQILTIFSLNCWNSLLSGLPEASLSQLNLFFIIIRIDLFKMQIWPLFLSWKHFHWLLFCTGQNSNSLVGQARTLIDALSPGYSSRRTLPFVFATILFIGSVTRG